MNSTPNIEGNVSNTETNAFSSDDEAASRSLWREAFENRRIARITRVHTRGISNNFQPYFHTMDHDGQSPIGSSSSAASAQIQALVSLETAQNNARYMNSQQRNSSDHDPHLSNAYQSTTEGIHYNAPSSTQYQSTRSPLLHDAGSRDMQMQEAALHHEDIFLTENSSLVDYHYDDVYTPRDEFDPFYQRTPQMASNTATDDLPYITSTHSNFGLPYSSTISDYPPSGGRTSLYPGPTYSTSAQLQEPANFAYTHVSQQPYMNPIYPQHLTDTTYDASRSTVLPMNQGYASYQGATTRQGSHATVGPSPLTSSAMSYISERRPASYQGVKASTRPFTRSMRVPSPSPEELNGATNKRAREALYTWYERLGELYKYKEDHGHCNVPQQYQGNRQLGIWVNKQRMEKKAWDTKNTPDQLATSLTVHKLRHLEEIGFAWAKPKGEASWYEKYYELLEYKEKNGHSNVPTKYLPNPALGRWVSTQRSQYKQFQNGQQSKMTQDRIDKLNRIHFCWDMIVRQGDDPGQGSSFGSTSVS